MSSETFFLTVFGVALFCFCSCNNQSSHEDHSVLKKVTFHNEKDYLIMEKYDNTGKIEIKQHFNLDTIPKGAGIYYYPNGKIRKWLWYSADRVHPLCGVNYKIDGSVEKMNGNPFVDYFIKTKNGQSYVEVVNPPQLSFLVEYLDVINGETINRELFGPGNTDTTAWVSLGKTSTKPKHKYYLVFSIIDTVTTTFLKRYQFEAIHDSTRTQ